MSVLRFYVFTVFCFTATISFAQQKTQFHLIFDSTFTWSNTLETQLNKSQPKDYNQYLLYKLYELGFLESRIDSSILKENNLFIYCHTGKIYEWVELKTDWKDEVILSKQRFREKSFNTTTFSPTQTSSLLKGIITYLEDDGYPFAQTKLDSLQISENTIQAKLVIEKGPLITIDSISIIGDVKITPNYIANYIGIKKGSPYNESLIQEISTRLNELQFVEQAAPPEVLFTSERTVLVLAINKKKANNFNGIIGFQPDEETSEIVFTGDVELNLLSALGKGEAIDLEWQRLQTQTQNILIHTNLPYLFKTPIGLDAELQIYREDTSFSTVTALAALQYALKGGDYFEVTIKNTSSSLISTTEYENATTLPDESDVKYLEYGIGLKSSRLDYRLNPRSGYSLKINGGVGEKEILKNQNLENINYDTIDLKTTQYTVTGNLDFYIPIIKKATINYGVQGGTIINENLFRNEIYRIGGLYTLRGFDEQSIYASSYVIQSLELRWLLEQNSYTYLFFDYGWYERNLASEFVTDTPHGFGAGVSFQTGAGIFSINYALGKQFDNPIQIRSGKIHFGFVNYF